MVASKFISCRSRDFRTSDKHYMQCEKHKSPFVVVRRGNKWSTIEWDCMSLPCTWDGFIDANEAAINNRVLGIFQRYATKKKSHYDFTAFVGSIENIDVELADRVAEEIFDVINEYLPSQMPAQCQQMA